MQERDRLDAKQWNEVRDLRERLMATGAEELKQLMKTKEKRGMLGWLIDVMTGS